MDSILVVDDEADIQKLVSENLVVRGYQVKVASTATEALDKLHDELPSLMVLDIKLPDFTGWELLERVRHDPLVPDHFPVLIMTASITDANMNLAHYPSVAEVLIKPFSSSTLVSAVKRTIDQQRQ